MDIRKDENKNLLEKQKTFDLKSIGPWKKGLILNLILVGIFLIIKPLFTNFQFGLGSIIFEFCTMIFAFFIPIALTVKYSDWKKEDFGLIWSTNGFFVGFLFYLLAATFFVIYRIFFSGWQRANIFGLIVRLILTLFIVILVDLWFHGFLFLGVLKNHNWKIALLVQNVYWFLFHIFEILALFRYIGIFGTFLYIFLVGFIGDLIAYKYKSVIGLMVGHFALNVLIVIFARISM